MESDAFLAWTDYRWDCFSRLKASQMSPMTDGLKWVWPDYDGFHRARDNSTCLLEAVQSPPTFMIGMRRRDGICDDLWQRHHVEATVLEVAFLNTSDTPSCSYGILHVKSTLSVCIFLTPHHRHKAFSMLSPHFPFALSIITHWSNTTHCFHGLNFSGLISDSTWYK